LVISVRSVEILPILTLSVILTATAALADGPGAYRDRHRSSETAQEKSSRDAYDAGVALIAQAEQQQAQPLQDNARRSYEQALARFDEATRLEPKFYEAHTYLGYVNRKLGRNDRALEAYVTALRLKPDYLPAIEYQGEAFLGLDRFEEARFNYLRLYATAPDQADKLLDAMQAWVAAKRKNPGGIAAADIAAFDDWVSQRIAARLLTGRKGAPAWKEN
jgi:tetratricopeptide (TPR) repeat protein